MAFEEIRYVTEGKIAILTMNRPERMNALTHLMGGEILEALDRADRDDGVRALIVTGAGRAFCVGIDLQDPEWADRPESYQDSIPSRDLGGLISLRLFAMKKPVIAAINGAAIGVGLTLTLPMDIRLVTDGAKMGFVFVRRGLIPEACSSWFLPRLVGIGRALEWTTTGRLFKGAEALSSGLVHRVCPAEETLSEARGLAKDIAENCSAVAVALNRQLMWRMLGEAHPMSAHRLDSRAMDFLFGSPDYREGMASFLEKRPPQFSMKPGSDMPDFYAWWEDPHFKENR